MKVASRPMIEVASEAWGAELPDWVIVLAKACDDTSQNQVAKSLSRSPSLVGETLRRNYKGNLRAVEEVVRGRLMNDTVTCPALGKLPMHECQSWRAQSRNFQGNNSLRVRMFRACNRCPIKAAIDLEQAK